MVLVPILRFVNHDSPLPDGVPVYRKFARQAVVNTLLVK